MSAKAIEAARAFVRAYWDDNAVRRGIANMQSMLNSAAASIGKVGAGLAAAGGTILAPMTAAVMQFAAAGDKLDKMSGRTGVSAEALSQLAYAAGQSGTSIETVEKGMRKLAQVSTQAADGSKTAQEALAAVGLTADSLRGMSPDQQFLAIAQGLAGISDPGERAARAMELLGKSGAEMLPLMANGAQGISDLMQQADGLGLTISQDQATAAAKFGDAMDDVKSAMGAIVTQIGAALAPALTDLAKLVPPLIVRVNQFVRENGGLILGVGMAGVALVALGTALGVIAGTLAAVSAGLGVLVSPLALVIGLAVALGVAFVKSAGGIEQALSMITGLFPGLSSAAGETFAAIKKLLASGQYSAAAKVLWLSLKSAWLTGVDALNRELLIWKKAFLDTFSSVMQAAQKQWRSWQNTIAQGTVKLMAFFDSSIDENAVLQTLQEDYNRETERLKQQAEQKQAARDAAFESNIGQVNEELQAARDEWAAAVAQAQQQTTGGEAATVAGAAVSDDLQALLDSMQNGDLATGINTSQQKSTGSPQDVRTVEGAKQLTSLINRQGDVPKRQLQMLQKIAQNTANISAQPQVVNI